MVLENFEIAQIRMGINDGVFDVYFRGQSYELKSKDWYKARKEATKILNDKFPDVVIYLQ